jgi:hypothetical protein
MKAAGAASTGAWPQGESMLGKCLGGNVPCVVSPVWSMLQWKILGCPRKLRPQRWPSPISGQAPGVCPRAGRPRVVKPMMVEAQICQSLGRANLWILNSGVKAIHGRPDSVNCKHQ